MIQPLVTIGLLDNIMPQRVVKDRSRGMALYEVVPCDGIDSLVG